MRTPSPDREGDTLITWLPAEGLKNPRDDNAEEIVDGRVSFKSKLLTLNVFLRVYDLNALTLWWLSNSFDWTCFFLSLVGFKDRGLIGWTSCLGEIVSKSSDEDDRRVDSQPQLRSAALRTFLLKRNGDSNELDCIEKNE